MSSDDTMLRLRRANPAKTEAVERSQLFEAIISSPGDPALARERRRSGRSKWPRIAVVAAALFIGVGAAWAATGGPLELFRSNPQGNPADPTSMWNQQVVPESVSRAAVLNIPNHGNVEFWYAETLEGGWCGAVRLNDGAWAGTKGTDGGTAPGCYPTREQINGDDPVFELTGFDYYEVQLDARDEGGTFWRIYYGIVSAPAEPVVRVFDRVSRREAVVGKAKAFAIAVPDENPDRNVPLTGYALDLIALDSKNEVIAEEHPQQK